MTAFFTVSVFVLQLYLGAHLYLSSFILSNMTASLAT